MQSDEKNSISIVPWKLYITTTVESVLAFYLATFCLVMFFTHRGEHWVSSGVILSILYLFVIAVCAKRIFAKLPMAAIMLIIPIAPLLALIMVLSFIPILEKLL